MSQIERKRANLGFVQGAANLLGNLPPTAVADPAANNKGGYTFTYAGPDGRPQIAVETGSRTNAITNTNENFMDVTRQINGTPYIARYPVTAENGQMSLGAAEYFSLAQTGNPPTWQATRLADTRLTPAEQTAIRGQLDEVRDLATSGTPSILGTSFEAGGNVVTRHAAADPAVVNPRVAAPTMTA